MKSKLFVIAALFVSLISCKNDDNAEVVASCNTIQISNTIYENAPSDEHEILTAEIIDDCLILLVRYGGGGGEVFGDLVTQEDAVENGTERNLRFLFDDQSPRDALLSETFKYNLMPLQNTTVRTIQFNLEGFTEIILYSY